MSAEILVKIRDTNGRIVQLHNHGCCTSYPFFVEMARFIASFSAVVAFANNAARIFVLPEVTEDATEPDPGSPEMALRIWLKCSAVIVDPAVALGIEPVLPPHAETLLMRLFQAVAVRFVTGWPAWIFVASSFVHAKYPIALLVVALMLLLCR